MKLKLDYSCPHCGATADLRAGRVTVFHSSWCPRRSRISARTPQRFRRGRCTVCGCLVPVAAGHRHQFEAPNRDAMR
jgi:hypothetical protein